MFLRHGRQKGDKYECRGYCGLLHGETRSQNNQMEMENECSNAAIHNGQESFIPEYRDGSTHAKQKTMEHVITKTKGAQLSQQTQ